MCGRPYNSVKMRCTICTHNTSCSILYDLFYQRKTVKALLVPVPRECSCKWRTWYVFRPRPDSEHLVGWTWTSMVHHFAETESPFALLHKNATCRASERWSAIHNVEFQRRSSVLCSGWRQEVQIGKHLPAVGKHSSHTVSTTDSRRKLGVFHLTWTIDYVMTEPGEPDTTDTVRNCSNFLRTGIM